MGAGNLFRSILSLAVRGHALRPMIRLGSMYTGSVWRKPSRAGTWLRG